MVKEQIRDNNMIKNCNNNKNKKRLNSNPLAINKEMKRIDTIIE